MDENQNPVTPEQEEVKPTEPTPETPAEGEAAA